MAFQNGLTRLFGHVRAFGDRRGECRHDFALSLIPIVGGAGVGLISRAQ